MKNPLVARPAICATLLAIALAVVPTQALAQGPPAVSQLRVAVSASSTAGGFQSSDEIFPIDDVTISHSSGGMDAYANYVGQIIRVEASGSWPALEPNAFAGAQIRLQDRFTPSAPMGNTDTGAYLSYAIALSGSLAESNGFASWMAEGQLSAVAYRDPVLGIVLPQVSFTARNTTLIDNPEIPLPTTLTTATTQPGHTSYFLWGAPIDLTWLVAVHVAGDQQLAGSAAADLSRSAVWLGITARNAQGEIIEGVQISSLSGTNWMNAAVVPEPTLLWLGLPAAGALVLCRYRRRVA